MKEKNTAKLFIIFTDDGILRDLLFKQITHLSIDITTTTELCSETFEKILAILLALCGRLTVLNFCDVFPTRKCSIFLSPAKSTHYISSTLVKLKINVATFADCLVLLDGRLESLSTFIVHVSSIRNAIIVADRTVSTTVFIATYPLNIRLYCFTEETSKTEMFIIHIVQLHIPL